MASVRGRLPRVLPYVAASAGSSDADFELLHAILSQVPEIKFVCLDVANGCSEFASDVRRVHAAFPEHCIAAGNVVTGEMVEELLLSGADSKSGHRPWQCLHHRRQTGVEFTLGFLRSSNVQTLLVNINRHIISDGGCTCPGDFSKALRWCRLCSGNTFFSL